jgi:hypothetical protein
VKKKNDQTLITGRWDGMDQIQSEIKGNVGLLSQITTSTRRKDRKISSHTIIP